MMGTRWCNVIKAGQYATVVYHDRDEVAGLVGDQDANTIEIMLFFEGVRHIPWQAIRYIEVGPGGYDIDDDDDGDDGDDNPDDPSVLVVATPSSETSEVELGSSGYVLKGL